MGKKAIVLAIMLFLALTGCTQAEKEKEFSALSELGSREFNYSFMLSSSDGRQSEEMVLGMKLVGEKEFGGQNCSLIAFEFDGTADHEECFFEENRELFLAGMEFDGKQVVFSPPLPLLKKPFEAGETWNWAGLEGEHESSAEFEIEGIEILEVFGEEVEAIAVHSFTERSDGPVIDSTKWFAEGIGLVKEEITIVNENFPGMKMKIETELK